MEPGEFSSVESAFATVVSGNFEPNLVDLFLPILQGQYTEYGNWSNVRALLVGLGQLRPTQDLFEQIENNERPFAESIAEFGMHNLPAGASPGSPVQELGQKFDFLGSTCFLPNLTPIQVINLLLFRTIRPTKQVAVVATIRDEGVSILEWIAFHRAIGVADIFVYSNDNVDGSDELLECLARAGVIKLIKNSIAQGTDPQRKAYQHAVHLLRELRSYRWVLFLDADEFLVLDEQFDFRLDPYLLHIESKCEGKLPGGVVFPWDWRFSELRFENTDGLMFERFPYSVSHFMVKSLTRVSAAVGMCEVHIPTLEAGAILVDSALEPVEADFVWSSAQKSRAGGAVAHFWGKSFEEFAVKKRRGELLSLDKLWLREFKQYFEWRGDLSAETFRPAPPVLLQRTREALKEMKEIPGVIAACEQVDARHRELCERIQTETNLRDVFDELRITIRPVFK